MFTGIIAGLGEILQIRDLGKEKGFNIQPLFSMPDIMDGESIAINGACLSVEKHTDKYFSVYSSAETVKKTNLKHLLPGQKVNLERALALGERLGGHIVSGHIDCVARLAAIQKAGLSLSMRFQFPEEFASQIVPKGSIALNGISLTVNACGTNWLEVNIIPDSQKRTNILSWRPSDEINMETDIIGKYVQHMLTPWENAAARHRDAKMRGLLAENGFL